MRIQVLLLGLAAMVWASCTSETESQTQTDEAVVTDKPSLAQDAPPQMAQVKISMPAESFWTEKYSLEVKAKFKAESEEKGLYKITVKAGIKHTVKPDDNGHAVEHIELQSLNYNLYNGGKTVDYTFGGTKAEYDNLMNRPIRLELDATTGKVLSLANQENLLVDLVGGKWKNGGKEKIQAMLGRFYEVNPPKPMKIGETWQTQYQVDWFPHFVLDRTYIVDAYDAKSLILTTQGTISNNPSAVPVGFKDDRSLISADNGSETGRIVVDRNTGMVISRQYSCSVAGSFLPVSGKGLPMEMEILESTETTSELTQGAPQK